MSSTLQMPASAFMLFSDGAAAVVEPEPKPKPPPAVVDPTLEIRRELQSEFDLRLAQEVARSTAAQKERYEALLQGCSAQFDGVIGELRREIQDKVVDLSIQLAEVIVRHELPDQEMVRQLIKKTLDPISDLQGARVRICPADRELLGDLGEGLEGVQGAVEFVDDPKLGRGDVMVESRNGIFDARLVERIKLLKETLYERSGRKNNAAPEV